MGTAASAKKRPPSPEAMKRNTQIEKELALSRVMETKTIKLLLLGGPESGKSTIAKQMKILHLNGFSEYDLLHYRHLIHSNIITAFRQLISAIECLKIDATENQKMMISNFVQISDRSKNCEISQELVFLAKALLPTSCFLEALQRRSEFELLDSAKYFFDDLDRITELSYVPTSQDILRSRAVTLGIHEVEFNYKNYIFRFYDA
uniref:Uncharacterized protein n=1 Tax=Romanomermis culicivorax TaxID=13658 RepID=A0A915JSI4_ROMCU